MAKFKTNYKDEIPKDGIALYNLINENGTIVQKNVKIVRSNGNEQEGDLFGAVQLNQICEALNIALFPISEGEGYIEVGNYEEYLKSLEK